MYRAVVFDLWGTLVRWPGDSSARLRGHWATRLGLPVERLDELWVEAGAYEQRESGPLLPYLETVRVAAGSTLDVTEFLEWRLDLTRHALVSDRDTVDTLGELRRRQYGLAVVSNCTEDVAIVWPETELASLFDVAVFSAVAGFLKPDRRIYELACSELGVAPAECLFVGDGANRELPGALEVGMTPVLIHGDVEPPWEDVREWAGLRITAIPHVLELVP